MKNELKAKLAAKAKQTLKDHAKVDVVYVTTDGHAFLPNAKGLALDHARKNAGECFEYTREEIEANKIDKGSKGKGSENSRGKKDNGSPVLIAGKTKSDWLKTTVKQVGKAVESIDSVEALQSLLDNECIDTAGGREHVQGRIESLKQKAKEEAEAAEKEAAEEAAKEAEENSKDTETESTEGDQTGGKTPEESTDDKADSNEKKE